MATKTCGITGSCHGITHIDIVRVDCYHPNVMCSRLCHARNYLIGTQCGSVCVASSQNDFLLYAVGKRSLPEVAFP